MSKFERDADKESFWRLAVGEQRASGLSVRAFCSREGLTESNFYAWHRQLVRRDAEASAAGSPKFVGDSSRPDAVPTSGGGGER